MKGKEIFYITLSAVVLMQCQTPTNDITMKQNKNKELITQFYNEGLNKGNVVVLTNIMANDFVDHNSGPEGQGIEGFKVFLNMVTSAFPDLHIIVEDMVAEGNKVTARITVTGTQSGTLLGKIPPSNRKAKWTGIDIFEIKESKIVGRWHERNLLSMMRQIGAIPD